MSILNSFVKEYSDKFFEKEEVFETGLVGDIKKVSVKLMDEKFHPSFQLKSILDKQLRRARYPMEVAITGQFSSGKSTFLNALLSKNILPTGITPVTSKVNFLNYGEEYKLKITYYSGAQEYAPIEAIADFTDQRKSEMSEIKYLTLYAPMDILKDISFVDTPGLNSQSQSDTDTTRKVLRDVGGIIWLTLIDNAGKKSEAEVLEEYMEQFKNKSLCVLNQKDKFTQEQIETTTKYVREKFSKYFAQVTPISAKMALQARAHDKDVLMNDEYEKFISEFKNDLKNNEVESLNFFENKFKEYKNKISKINLQDSKNNIKLQEESNIQKVIDFIENTIRPQALESKEFAIKRDLMGICDILVSEYQNILGVYDKLVEILK
ncbi:MAG: dynamin family protein, partial [Arcobacter sp.]